MSQHASQSQYYPPGAMVTAPNSGETFRRRMNLILLGVLLLAGFFLPLFRPVFDDDRVGHVKTEQVNIKVFDSEWRTQTRASNMRIAFLVFPGAAGLLVILLSSILGNRPRGVVLFLLGSVFFIFVASNEEFRQRVQSAFEFFGRGGEITHLTLWPLLGWLGLFAGARCAWYRPGHIPGYLVGIAGGALAVLMLVLPIYPDPADGAKQIAAISAPIKLLESNEREVWVKGIFMLAPMVGVGLATLLCLCNVPVPGSRASRPLGGLATAVLLLGTIAGAAGPIVTSMCFEDTQTVVMLSALGGFAKFGVWFAGLLLIVPVALVDLLIGRPPRLFVPAIPTAPVAAPAPPPPSAPTVIVQSPPAPPPSAPTPSLAASATPEARLAKLNELKEAGLINDEDFEKCKQEIISSI